MPPMPGIPCGVAVRNTLVEFEGYMNQGEAPRLLCRGGAPSPPGEKT